MLLDFSMIDSDGQKANFSMTTPTGMNTNANGGFKYFDIILDMVEIIVKVIRMMFNMWRKHCTMDEKELDAL